MHKNVFGHVLILAGSQRMLGAAALSGLAAMRSGAGLVSIGVPKSFNTALQKKISPVIMTFPLPETKTGSLSPAAWTHIRRAGNSFTAVAVGPGLSQAPGTQQLIRKVIAESGKPLVIDADALNALKGHLGVLKKNQGIKILTPHSGEMARLTGMKKADIEKHRKKTALTFAKTYRCLVVLKGHRSVVASPDGRCSVNTTGNAGLATAGSGDVLTGMIAAFLAQGIPAFDAARWAVRLHGKAGDHAAKVKSKAGMIATDVIDAIPAVLKAAK